LAQVDFHIENEYEVVNEQISLMKLCRDTSELEMFDSDSLLQIIKFKWNSYGLMNHAFGCMMHLFTVLVIVIYVNNAYIAESGDQVSYAALLIAGIIYPCFYETQQFI
jgi:hypothetical protein